MTGSLTFVSCHSWFQLALFQYDIIFIKGRYGLLKYAYKKGRIQGFGREGVEALFSFIPTDDLPFVPETRDFSNYY